MNVGKRGFSAPTAASKDTDSKSASVPLRELLGTMQWRRLVSCLLNTFATVERLPPRASTP
jgi:hypothetical protein